MDGLTLFLTILTVLSFILALLPVLGFSYDLRSRLLNWRAGRSAQSALNRIEQLLEELDVIGELKNNPDRNSQFGIQGVLAGVVIILFSLGVATLMLTMLSLSLPAFFVVLMLMVSTVPVGLAVNRLSTIARKMRKSLYFDEYVNQTEKEIAKLEERVTRGSLALSDDIKQRLDARFNPPAQSEGETRLPKLMAYYLAHAIANESFLISRGVETETEVIAIVLLYLSTRDSRFLSKSNKYVAPIQHLASMGSTFEEQFEYIENADVELVNALMGAAVSLLLRFHNHYFVKIYNETKYHLVNDYGKETLKTDWPKIWQKFNLDSVSS